jgi:hypothetical protein
MLKPMQIKRAQAAKIMPGLIPDFSQAAAPKPSNATAIILNATFFILQP